jgi:hypothetical protein
LEDRGDREARSADSKGAHARNEVFHAKSVFRRLCRRWNAELDCPFRFRASGLSVNLISRVFPKTFGPRVEHFGQLINRALAGMRGNRGSTDPDRLSVPKR